MFFSPLRVTLIVSFLLIPICTFAQDDNSSPLEGIFPPLTPFVNYGNLMVTYDSSGFVLQGDNSGVETTPNDTSIAPDTISVTPFEGYGNPFFPINTTQLYTLVMIDPDAPSRANPTAAQILHFVQTGLKITTGLGESTETECFGLTSTVAPVVPYRGPAPPVDTGLHRYIFLLFMQPEDTVDLGSFSADSRRNFDIESFARNNTFGSPLAGAYFQAQNAANSGNTTVPETTPDTGNDDDTTDNEDLLVDEPSVDDPLLIDTSTPTPPARQTGDVTMTLSEIVYEGTLTLSLGPEITGKVDSEPITDSKQYPGGIGEWTMTAPGGRDEREITTSTKTSTVPVPTLEMATGSVTSVPTSQSSSNSDGPSIAGIQDAETEKPSPSTPSWLDDSVDDENSAVKAAGVTIILMGGLAIGTVLFTYIL